MKNTIRAEDYGIVAVGLVAYKSCHGGGKEGEQAEARGRQVLIEMTNELNSNK